MNLTQVRMIHTSVRSHASTYCRGHYDAINGKRNGGAKGAVEEKFCLIWTCFHELAKDTMVTLSFCTVC